MARDTIKSKPEKSEKEHVLVRFENKRSSPIGVHWVGYKGEEKLYKTLHGGGRSYVQSTYASHVWRVKADDGSVLKEYSGPSATLSFTDDGVSILPGLVKPVFEPCTHPTEPSYGYYHQRETVCGMPLMAFDCVTDEAVTATKITIEHMMKDVRPSIINRMVDLGAQVAIIGKNQVTTDIPDHWHLKGQKCEDGREYDKGTRGLGGNISHPTMSVAEENVLLIDENKYPSESLLVHEFAHSVMNLGLYHEPEFKAIKIAYAHAMEKELYDKDAYVSANADEYFAECSQAWFDATIREDATSGVISRDLLKKKDPLMATILVAVWGDGDWRYPQTAPAPFKQRRSSSSSKTNSSTKGKKKKKQGGGFLSNVFKRQTRAATAEKKSK